ncbi:MAG: DUF4114 domain-containing protein [Verrucomicrobiae bacterium]
MKAIRFSERTVGFTMIEVLAVIAAMAVISSVGFVAVSNVKQAADESKLEQDVESINRSIQVYMSSGGNMDGITGANDGTSSSCDVLTRLKSSGSTNTIGVRGSTLDSRIFAVTTGSSSSSRRATFVASTNSGVPPRFVVTNSTNGNNLILGFRMNEDLAADASATNSRTASKYLNTSTNNPGWVWDNAPPVEVPNATTYTPQTGGIPPTGLSDAVNQGFPGGYWTVGASGIVPVSYVYREAGYSSRLALFSLEGMGPDVYNLDTPEGQRDFLMEALRRIMAGDRAQTIIDVSQDQPIANPVNQLRVVDNKQFTFRPGDTVAAIMIPNDTMQNAWNALNGLGTLSSSSTALQTLAQNSGTKFPLTSLSRTNAAGGSTTFPFYADQYASLGVGTTAYSIEDTRVAGDGDYQDLIFKASNMIAPDGSFTRTIDPATYYAHWDNPTTVAVENINKLDTVGTGGGMTLRQALTAAGIMQ